MEKKNKYAYHSHLSERKFKELVRCFAFDFDGKKASDMTSVNRNTVNKYYLLFSESNAYLCKVESLFPKG